MSDSLATALGGDSYTGLLVKVSLQIYANNGRSGTFKNVKIYTPRPMLNFAIDSTQYRVTITDGNTLSSTALASCAQIDQRARTRQPVWANVTFLMQMDGAPLAADGPGGGVNAGKPYIVAFGQNGETIPERPPDAAGYRSDNSRADLYFGDPPSDTSSYPSYTHWIGSAVRGLEITLASHDPIRSRVNSNRQAFS